MRNLTIAIALTLLFHGAAYAGSITQDKSPNNADTKMWTLNQIYTKVHSGAPVPADKHTGTFVPPDVGPGSTMYTLDNIYNDFTVDATACNGTLAADVLAGKTFFATSGAVRGTSWGPVAGTMATQTLSAANETVAAGYYAATTLSAVDPDLAVGNIKSGTTIFGFLGTYSGGGSAGVPKTGQTTIDTTYDDAWYVTNGNIGLPKSGSHYTDNGDGTITDNATGLEWVASPTAAGVGGTYTWAGAITACEGLTYAGHSDWRLPNIKELISIVDYGRSNPCIDPLFTCESYPYWSSTTYASDAIYAWSVYFYSGLVGYGTKTSVAYYVRPVRGG